MTDAKPLAGIAARPAFATIGFALALLGLWLIPSLGQLVKHAGVAGAGGLTVVAFAGLWALLTCAERGWLEPTTAWFVALCVLAMVLFAVLYPLAQGGRFGGGSARDDALNDALHLLIAGNYPYSAITYLGNPPTPMPGALLLAAPFHVLGNGAWQNLLWVPAFILWCRMQFATSAAAWIAGLVIVFASTQALDDFVVGGDYLVNALYVAMAADWCIRAHRGEQFWARVATTILLAIAVSSRPIYAVALMVVAGHVWQAHGVARCARFVALAGTVALALNLPFYLHDPAHFPTAHLLGKLDGQRGARLVKVALPALGLLVAVAAFT